MLLLLLPLLLLVQKQLMLLHDSGLLAAEVLGAAVGAGHRHGRLLAPDAGGLGRHRDAGGVLLLSEETKHNQHSPVGSALPVRMPPSPPRPLEQPATNGVG